MKKFFLTSIAAILWASFANAQSTPATIDSISYALGSNIGHSLKTFPVKLNASSLSKAIIDALEGKAGMTIEESEMYLQSFFLRQQAEKIGKNKKEGEAFLNTNKDKPGVVVSPSGLQYKIERVGTGISPTENDEVEVHYKGTLVDGRVFDSSYDRGETITFPLKGVIKGWTEGLQHAKEGGKIMLYIPSDLAYGDTTSPSKIIEGGSTLIFEIELIKVIKNNNEIR